MLWTYGGSRLEVWLQVRGWASVWQGMVCRTEGQGPGRSGATPENPVVEPQDSWTTGGPKEVGGWAPDESWILQSGQVGLGLRLAGQEGRVLGFGQTGDIH